MNDFGAERFHLAAFAYLIIAVLFLHIHTHVFWALGVAHQGSWFSRSVRLWVGLGAEEDLVSVEVLSPFPPLGLISPPAWSSLCVTLVLLCTQRCMEQSLITVELAS